ncbi:M3 family metallopeptidase [Sphingosinithalassobacter sp. LHW66-3]|uniref:M3 family metallopeptidase n=1 Tax=Sphingosinithalassobacter sp. LHW66-3 TaxID=3424718 RepID=UPI003D6C6709
MSFRLRIALLATTSVLMTSPVTASTLQTDPTETVAAQQAAVDPAPLLEPWTGPYDGVPPWDRITADMFPAAFEAAMANARTEFAAIRDNPAAPTFENTIEAQERSGAQLGRLFSAWGVYQSNLATPEVQAIAREWSPKLSAFFTELSLDPEMFARVKAVYDNREQANLTPQQMRLLERTYRDYVTSGALLNAEQKAEISRINQELAGLYADFSQKVLADEETAIFLESQDDLAGLPESFAASLKAEAVERGQPDQWAVKNTRSSMQPFLMYSTRRDLREQVWRAYVDRGDNGGANDTNQTIAQILALRQERAELLGFENHAYYRMDDTMAETPAAATELMMAVWPAAVARVREEVDDMQALADQEGADIVIEPWDYRFYAEKVRKAKYDLDESEVKPYLQLDNIVDAAFYSAGRLYDISFEENTGSIPVFHPDVRTFEVTDNKSGETIGVFYLDNFARSGKRSGAWATSYRSRSGLRGEDIVLASNNNNFTEGAEGEPTLISLDDATTLFHEFGHALHSFLSDVHYPGLAGTPRDFVEYPSQVNENWLLTRDVLDRYARHYQTRAPMPQELVDKIEASSTFNQGFDTVEYLASAIVDMKLHDRSEPVTDVDAFERETLAEIGMPVEIVMRHRLPQFNHLFSSDSYSAGYYSYLWSETMDADTWAAFEATGNVWDPATAQRFRDTLLSTGNETDRKAAYRAFRGRDPDVQALFRRRGFPTGE